MTRIVTLRFGVLAIVLVLVVSLLAFAMVTRFLNPPVSPLVESSVEQGTPIVIQCDIVNASRTDGAGRVAMKFLRERGFDVVDVTSDEPTRKATHVLDRVGDRQSARQVARALGIADTLVLSRIDSMLFVRATVVLGTDVMSILPFKD